MLFRETVSPETLDLLKILQSLPEFRDLRLVGGTSLALQIGHRKSVDLDFFGKISESLEELTHIIGQFATVEPLSSSRMMRFFRVNGVKVDIVNYPYPWIGDAVEEDGIVLAGIKDIAAMKLAAITNRGTKKDFIDYYFLLQQYEFIDLLGFYLQKYPDAQLFAPLKSLTYFDDANQDPMPFMYKNVEWDEVKSHISRIVSDYYRQR